MKPFTKHELLGVLTILVVVGALTLTGLITSLRRSRDAQRMADLGAISNALDQFHEEYGFFPPSEKGNIKACKGDNFNEVLEKLKNAPQFDREVFESGLRACTWGNDSLRDVADDSRNPYMTVLPVDPKSKAGQSYLYITNGRRYQLFARLEEGSDEDFYDSHVFRRSLQCGREICNVGKGFANTPVDRSIEEYEAELMEKAGNK